jgi:hypothetical protein
MAVLKPHCHQNRWDQYSISSQVQTCFTAMFEAY